MHTYMHNSSTKKTQEYFKFLLWLRNGDIPTCPVMRVDSHFGLSHRDDHLAGEILMIEVGLFVLAIILLTKPCGIYLSKVLDPKESTFLDPVLKPIERGFYRIAGIDPLAEQDWKKYLLSLLNFSFISCLATALLLACQYYLPFNPQGFAAPSWHLNFNTSISFMTNTNWQSYSGETTMSYFSQMAALTVQNFVSPAVGLSAAAALVRGIARKNRSTIGNFWADLVRICLYLFLPLGMLVSGIFIFEGVPQNLQAYVKATTLEGQEQIIVQGPIASQEAIKLIGSNGGGFTNANSAHPYENPTPLTNYLQLILILLIPAGQIYYYGKEVGDTKHAWCIFTALLIVFLATVWGSAHFEIEANNWEGKEQRFGLLNSALYACVTTAVSCGATQSCLDSFTPMGGFFPLLNMELSECIFGGVGAGLYSVLIYILLSIFISGLIIGRTPEYLGKKIEAFDIKMAVLATLAYILLVHAFTAWACLSEWGKSALGNSGPHGFTEMLYAFSSTSANNGSAFAGLSSNTPGWNMMLGIAMLLGRFLVIAAVIALAGSFVKKKYHPKTAGSFPVSSLIFTCLLIGVILLVGALTFLPALTMGPIIEEFDFLKGVLFQ
jgi:K+-transporting ATPase ATPase A chain